MASSGSARKPSNVTGKIGQYKPPITQPKKPKQKASRKTSDFFITISTLYRPKNEADYEDKATEFEEALIELFDENDIGNLVLKFIRGHEADADHWEDVIHKSAAEYGVEVGTDRRGHRIHAHVLLEIVHTSFIQVDREKIEEFLLNHLRWAKNIYVHIDMVNKSMRNILNYIRKDQEVTSDQISEAASQLSNISLLS